MEWQQEWASGGYGFQQCYHCYPVSFIDKAHLENGDKIIMPASALDHLARLHIDYPMLFKLNNSSADRVTHCGVLEFTAEEGYVYLPYWMMENMLLQEGDRVQLRNASLEKGTYVKLQPHTKDFLDISNPKAILETSLRSYSCLTTGDTIMVPYNNKKYYIDVIETKPDSAVSIIETDCEVDFAPPLDYKEPEKPKSSASSSKKPHDGDEESPKKMARFSSFTGSGRRLDGKAPSQSTESVSLLSELSQSNRGNDLANGRPLGNAFKPHGKLVFGSTLTRPQSETSREEDKGVSQKDEPFQAFTGKKYTLRD